MEATGQIHNQAPLPPWKSSSIPCTGDWGSPDGENAVKSENTYPEKIKPRFLGHPTRGKVTVFTELLRFHIWPTRSCTGKKLALLLSMPWRHIRGVEVYHHLFFKSAPDGNKWSAPRAGRFTPPAKCSWYPFKSRLGESRSHSRRFRRRKTLDPAGNRTPDGRVPSLITIPTELYLSHSRIVNQRCPDSSKFDQWFQRRNKRTCVNLKNRNTMWRFHPTAFTSLNGGQ